MNISLDWLSVSVRTPKGYDISVMELMNQIVDIMHLGGFYKKAVLVGGNKFYASVFRIDDISFKLAREREGASHKQGVMIEMTSNGLSKYIHHLREMDVQLIDVLKDIRSLSIAGYSVNYPRLDVAMDDIAHAGERPLLRMERIADAWEHHLFCSRARANDDEKNRDFDVDEPVTTGKICRNHKGGLVGKTIYFGADKSRVQVRFYDKRVEQLQHDKPVPADIEHWVRCEYEFHREAACAVVSMLIENTWDDFVHVFCKSVMGHLRFIVPDDTNRSRCSTCRWWTKFLNGVLEAENFFVPPKKAVSADRTVRWLRRSVLPTVYAYLATVGVEEFLDEVSASSSKLGYKQFQFLSDYVDCDEHSDTSSPFYDVVMWASMTCRPLYEVIEEMQANYKQLQIVKRYRLQLDSIGTTEQLVKFALGVSA